MNVNGFECGGAAEMEADVIICSKYRNYHEIVRKIDSNAKIHCENI